MKLIPELKQEAISELAHGVFGERLWNDVIMFAHDTDGISGLSGADKKAKVKKDLKIIFGDTAEFILNAAIDVAVMWLRSKD